ncbi:MAG: extensin family protein [Pseudolabrys sp.]|jgi:hypothetical protein
MRRLAVFFCIAVSGGVSPAFADDVPLPRPRPAVRAAPAPWREPMSFREAAGFFFRSSEVTSAPSACRSRLEQMAALVPMPRLIGPGGCGGGDMVELDAVLLAGGKRIELKPKPLLRCEMAEQFAFWVRDDVVTRVSQSKLTLASVETYDDYSCRGRNRVFGAKLSEHGKGNAVDVRSLTFADKHVAMLTDKTFAKDIRTDLRASACARFSTVLGPGSDGYHEEHIHLDLAQRRGGYKMCQWNVLEPPPPPPPPKPAEVAKVDTAKPEVMPEVTPEVTPEAKSEVRPEAAKPDEPADDGDVDDGAEAGKSAQPVQMTLADVPLPRPRPPKKAKKARRGVHFPFNLFR